MSDKLRDAAQAALEALECGDEETNPGHRCGHCDDYVDRNGLVRAALRAALAEPAPEPVAWQRRRLRPLGNPDDDDWITVREKLETRVPMEWRPLYVAPPTALAEPAPEPSGWIKCSERMPLNGDDVLAWETAAGAVVAIRYSASTTPWYIVGWLYAEYGNPNITHWMPLPAAPSAEGEA